MIRKRQQGEYDFPDACPKCNREYDGVEFINAGIEGKWFVFVHERKVLTGQDRYGNSVDAEGWSDGCYVRDTGQFTEET